MHSPILLIDIDGVISLFGFDPARPPEGKFLLVDGIPHFLSMEVARRIARLHADFDLVWCSGWEEKADEYLPLALGLPAGLPHLRFDATAAAAAGRDAAAGRRHWKLSAIDAYAGPDRPLAWVDDTFDASCHEWAAMRPAPTELVMTEPAVGLTARQAAGLTSWARSLKGTVPSGPGAESLQP